MSAGRGRRKKQKDSANGHESETGSEAPASEQPSADLAQAGAEAESGADTLAGAPEQAAEPTGELEASPSEPIAEGDAQPASTSGEVAQDAAWEGDGENDGEDDSDDADSAVTGVPPPTELDRQQQKAVLEALVFVSERTVTAAQLARAMKIRAAQVRELITELMRDYGGRGMELIEVAGGYQLRSAPACAPYVREFVAQKPVRLTRAQLETLALIAYRQPITRPEIDEVRGVDSGSAIRVLLERSLIKMLGRRDEAGRPLLYGTTSHFLEFFGMRSLKDLPTLREFTELSEENRALFKRKTGESVEEAEAELLTSDEAPNSDGQSEHVSDEDLAEVAAGSETDVPPPATMGEGEDATEGWPDPASADAREGEQDASSDVEAPDAHDGVESADPR